jgi:phage replisome organizer N-terminal domain protein
MKKYYWLKLQKDFFKDPRVKKLRRIAGGDTYTCIYLQLMLLSLETGGILTHEGIEPTFEAELSLIIDEDEDNIRVTLNFLLSQGLLEQFDNKFSLSQVINLIGTESDSAERVRKLRAKKKDVEALQCNDEVTSGNENVTTDIRDRERKNIKKESLQNSKNQTSEIQNTHTRKQNFVKPSLQDLENYKLERNLKMDCEEFYDYYESKGWVIGKAAMKDWRSAMRNWARNEGKFNSPPREPPRPKSYLDEYETLGER